MVKYRNVATGRVYERPGKDPWLEASSGWERVEDAPAPKAPARQNERSED